MQKVLLTADASIQDWLYRELILSRTWNVLYIPHTDIPHTESHFVTIVLGLFCYSIRSLLKRSIHTSYWEPLCHRWCINREHILREHNLAALSGQVRGWTCGHFSSFIYFFLLKQLYPDMFVDEPVAIFLARSSCEKEGVAQTPTGLLVTWESARALAHWRGRAARAIVRGKARARARSSTSARARGRGSEGNGGRGRENKRTKRRNAENKAMKRARQRARSHPALMQASDAALMQASERALMQASERAQKHRSTDATRRQMQATQKLRVVSQDSIRHVCPTAVTGHLTPHDTGSGLWHVPWLIPCRGVCGQWPWTRRSMSSFQCGSKARTKWPRFSLSIYITCSCVAYMILHIYMYIYVPNGRGYLYIYIWYIHLSLYMIWHVHIHIPNGRGYLSLYVQNVYRSSIMYII